MSTKRGIRFNLFAKFTIIVSLGLITSLSVTGFILITLQERALVAEKVKNARMLTNLVARISAFYIDKFLFSFLDENTIHLQSNSDENAEIDVLSVLIYDRDGKQLNPSGIPHEKITVPERFWRIEEQKAIYQSQRTESKEVGKVIMVFSLESIYKRSAQLRTSFILIVILTIIILDAIVGIMLMLIITNPLKMLTKSTKYIAAGNFDTRIDYKAEDELGELARNFNVMSRNLKESFDHIAQQNIELKHLQRELLNQNETLQLEIEERKRVEKALRESEEQFRAIVENTPGVVYCYEVYLGSRRSLLYVGPGLRELTGHATVDEFHGDVDRFFDLLHPEDRQRLINTGVLDPSNVCPIDVEYRVRTQSGDYTWVRSIARPFRQQDNSIHWHGVLLDIAEHKRAEEELRKHRERLEEMVEERTATLKLINEQLEQEITERKRAEEKLTKHAALLESANKELESFSYSVSHDLRTPLRAIDGFSQVLLEEYADHLDAEGKRVLGIICDNTQKMEQLIDDLLAFSRLGRQEMTCSEINMEALTKEIFQELKSITPDRQFRFNVGPLPGTYGDRALIRQVWVNLFSNAIKFTEPRERAVIEVGGKMEKDETLYYIKDNGVGFDINYAYKLFGVFQRLHSEKEFEGTGVGLALVQRIIHRHGGQVWAEGEVGKGATFYFSLPIKR